MIKIYILPIDEKINDNEFYRLLNFVSENRKESVQKFHFDIDKKLSLYSELLVRYIVCRELQISNDKIKFLHGKHGKPYIIDFPNFHYNISHTHSAIAAAFSDSPVGIDIEKIRIAETEIAKRFFAETEIKYVFDNYTEIDIHFFDIWTKKESYVKYTGYGLSTPLNSFDVCAEPLVNKIQTFEIMGYVISCCNDFANEKIDVINISENSLVQQFLKFSILK